MGSAGSGVISQKSPSNGTLPRAIEYKLPNLEKLRLEHYDFGPRGLGRPFGEFQQQVCFLNRLN